MKIVKLSEADHKLIKQKSVDLGISIPELMTKLVKHLDKVK